MPQARKQTKTKPRSTPKATAPQPPVPQIVSASVDGSVLNQLMAANLELDQLRAGTFLARITLENQLGWMEGRSFEDTPWEAGARFRKAEIQQALDQTQDVDLTRVIRSARVITSLHRAGQHGADLAEALDVMMLAMSRLDARDPSRNDPEATPTKG